MPFLLLFLSAALPVTLAAAQAGVTTHRDLPAVRLSDPPVIDGDLSDAAWREAARVEGFTDALFGTPAPDPTTAYLGYDERFLYVAFHCRDSQPEAIVARETKRGTAFRGEDTVSFSFDPFHTHGYQDRSFFTVNALGTHYSDMAGGRARKLEWEGDWQSAAMIAADGWSAEMAIPWSILNYPVSPDGGEGSGGAIAGLNFDRFQERTKIRSWWSNIGPNEFMEMAGHWVGVRYPPFRRTLSLLPYTSPGWLGGAGAMRTGLDIRSALTPSMTMIGTVNPDFRNVEGAVEGIDFSYGERYVPDRRPFFLEGSDVYYVDGAAGEFFHSNRIPGFDTGVSLYGRLLPKDTVGLLTAVDFGRRADWLLRGIHQFGPTSRGDLTFINRDDERGSNRVLVAGEDWRRGYWGFWANWAGSWVNGQFNGDTADLSANYKTPHWDIRLAPRFVRPGFRDDLGFINFTDYKGARTNLTYSTEWRKGFLRRLWIDHDYERDDHYDGSIFRRMHDFDIDLETRSDYSMSAGWSGGRFEGFHDRLYNASIRSRVSDPFHNFGVGVTWGRQAGESLFFVTPGMTWRFGDKLTLGASSAILRHAENREQHILTFNYDVTPRKGFGGRVVLRDGEFGGYLALRESGYGGVEKWLILGDPNSPKLRSHVVAKVVWPM